MENTSDQLFTLFCREDTPYIYVGFWDENLKKYLPGRSTGKTTKKEARNVAQAWLGMYNGPPPIEIKPKGITNKQLITYMTCFLEDNQQIEENQSLSVNELISKVSLMLTGNDINKDNPVFVDYCLQFWDWDTSLYIKDKIESGQTIGSTYCNSNKRFIEIYAVPFFKDMRIRSVTTAVMEKFKSELPRKTSNTKERLAPRSINAILGSIGTALQEAKRLGIINDNSASSMRKLSLNNTRRGVLTPEEVQKVLSAKWEDERSKTASQLAVCHGLRAGEIGALRIQDIDFVKNIIYVRGSWACLQTTRINYSNFQYLSLMEFTTILGLSRIITLH